MAAIDIPSKFLFNIVPDIISGKVSVVALTNALVQAALKPTAVAVDGNILIIAFNFTLSADEEILMRSIATGHDGNPATAVRFYASSTIIQSDAYIIQDSDWQILGGVVTNISFFVNPPQAFARVIGQFKSQGNRAQLRVVEHDDVGGEISMIQLPFDIPDTADEWKSYKFYTDVPPKQIGSRLYTLEGRLNGASAAAVRFTSMSLLEEYKIE